MKKLFTFVLATILMLNLSAQEQAPGLDILGYGYDVFGSYADQKSKKRYCLFKYSNFRTEMIGTNQYSVPQYVFLENISSHKVTTVQGSSMRQYAKSQSASVGLGVDALFFSASVNTSFSSSSSGTEQHFYYTYRDANTKWRVSFDERDYDNLDQILDPRFKSDLATMEPARLFELYGTHYIASAYLGGRADFHSVSVITSETNTSDIAVAVEAQYKAVTANVELSQQKSETLSNSKTKTTLIVTGGNSEYANNISDPVSYDKWASGIAGMPVLCDFDKNSLKPIWDFCETAARKAELKAEFAKMLKANPLPAAMAASMMVSNQVYFIGSVADQTLYIDMPGYHFDAYRAKGTHVNMYPKDNEELGLQGIDRFIKVIPHATENDYVFLQPQHSDLVFDVQGGSKSPGAKLHLWSKGNNNVAQMFKLIEVDGKSNTYFIQNKNSGLYLTSNGKSKQITQENITGKENQQWKFETAKASDMASMKVNVAYAFKNVKANRYLDLAGDNQNAKSKDCHIKLWNMNYKPDRYAQLKKSNLNGYYYVQHMHSKYVWDIEGGKKDNGTALQLYDKNDNSNQQFKFIYAGDAMTFYIQGRGSGKYIDASDSEIGKNGCKVQIYKGNKSDNQKWKLEPAGPKYFAPKRVKVKIKAAYSDKYWDLAGGPEKAKLTKSRLQIWANTNEVDRYYVIKSSGDHDWIWFELDGGLRIDVEGGNVNDKGTKLHTWTRHNGDAQKFAIHPTSRYTCVIYTKGWKALDMEGGEYNTDGTDIHLWSPHFGAAQQFQLIDAATNKPIDFYKYIK